MIFSRAIISSLMVWALIFGDVQSLTLTPTPARLLILDTLVPNQRLRLLEAEASPSFREFCKKEKSPIVVVGREGLSLHTRGVEVFLEDTPGYTVTLAATGRIAEICDEGTDEGSRWDGRDGRVTWLGSLEDDDLALSVGKEIKEATPENIMAFSERIGDLAREWEEALRVSGRERFPGHLEGILEDLGEIPNEPNMRALWVAGLINPLPALGVALEVRPAVLTARTTSRRLSMAEQGLRDSIDRIRRPGPCF